MDKDVDIATLIRQRFGSIHNFCKSTGFPRATVYQVSNGRYAGNIERQKQRILDFISPQKCTVFPVTMAHILEVLQACKCDKCRPVRKRKCTACRIQAMHEAQTLWEFIVKKYE